MLYHQLLVDLFQFLAPFLRNVELAKQTYLLYKVCVTIVNPNYYHFHRDNSIYHGQAILRCAVFIYFIAFHSINSIVLEF